MGVRILHDERADMASLYCSTSDFAFGPVFHASNGKDAEERAQAFLRWLDTYTPSSDDLIPLIGQRWHRDHDPRSLTDAGKERAYIAWLTQESAQYARESEAEVES